MSGIQTLPARRGAAVVVRKGQSIKIINSTGTQVVDTWAFVLKDVTVHSAVTEHLSLCHTRASTKHMSPRINDVLLSNRREPLLKVLEDTSPGRHDTLIAACDPRRYEQMGVKDWQNHGSCTENLIEALADFNRKAGREGEAAIGQGVAIDQVPSPLNLFMSIPWTEAGDLAFESSKAKPGDYVRLEAVQDVVVVLSACPMDVNPINGPEPQHAHYDVETIR